MLTISICVGSACHLKGSYKVIHSLKEIIAEYNLENKIELKGSFCLGHCTKAVSVKIENEDPIYSLNEENVRIFFESEIRRRI